MTEEPRRIATYDGKSTLRKRQLEAKCCESAGEGAAHPFQHVRTRDDVVSDRGGEHAVTDEDDEGEHHEDRAQFEHARQRVRLIGAHELGQKREEENRELRD